jgi:hypothetical protein
VNAVPTPSLACPLCGGENACAPARSGRFDAACWCEEASFGAALLGRIPEALRGVACVCATCARSGDDPPAAAG